jgi:hypothetical protein
MSGSQRGTVTRDEAAQAERPGAARRTPERAAAPILDTADPRLAHGPGAASGLMALQRTAGNAAVSSMVGSEPAVQRTVTIDEFSVTPLADGSGGADTSGAAADTADSDAGGEQTISGSSIHLAAPMTTADGVLRANTIIADSVIASSYTPGAGNVW